MSKELDKVLEEIEERLREKKKKEVTAKEKGEDFSTLEFTLHGLRYKLITDYSRENIRIHEYNMNDELEDIYTATTANGVCYLLGIW